MPGTRPGMTNSLKNKRFSSWPCLSRPSTSGRIRGLRPKYRFIHTLSGQDHCGRHHVAERAPRLHGIPQDRCSQRRPASIATAGSDQSRSSRPAHQTDPADRRLRPSATATIPIASPPSRGLLNPASMRSPPLISSASVHRDLTEASRFKYRDSSWRQRRESAILGLPI